MPRFDFELHEWPLGSSQSPEGFADAMWRTRWQGAEVELCARWVLCGRSGSLLFFRRLDDEMTWLVSHGPWAPGAFSFMVGHTGPQHIENTARQRVEKALRSGCYGQARNFDASRWGLTESQWLFLNVDGRRGSWNGAGSGPAAEASFEIATDSLEVEMDDAKSPVRFALEWSLMSPRERMEKAVRFRNGDWNELRAVVHAVGMAEATRFGQGERWTIVFSESLRFGRSMFARHPANGSARLRRWSHHLNRYFSPHIEESLKARYDYVSRLTMPYYVSVEAQLPSHHERLEAALFLREWARDKIPPDELRLLLPKL